MFHLTSKNTELEEHESIIVHSSRGENSMLAAKIESLEASQALEKYNMNAANKHVDAKLG